MSKKQVAIILLSKITAFELIYRCNLLHNAPNGCNAVTMIDRQ